MRKIALIGTASSGAKAPFHDKSWEIWGVSARADYVTRADKWFELHRLDGEPEDWANHWRACLKKFMADIPDLVMMYPESALAKGKVTQYPYGHIVERFGTFFMTSTFAWMMALAIDDLSPVKGKKTKGIISIYGVDMEHGTEYSQQRAGFRHFIELAKHMGIQVQRLADGGLTYEPVPYPMWQDDPMMAKNARKKKETLEQLEEVDGNRNRTEVLMAQNRAVMGELQKMKGMIPRLAELETEYTNLEKTLRSLKETIAQKRGQYEEQCWLHDYLQP